MVEFLIDREVIRLTDDFKKFSAPGTNSTCSLYIFSTIVVETLLELKRKVNKYKMRRIWKEY